MSNTEVEYPIGEYVDDSCHGRLWVLGVHGDARWIKFEDETLGTYSVASLRRLNTKPYVEPVVVDRRLYVSMGVSGNLETSYDHRYCGKLVCFTFHDGKLVKAEVEE